MAGDQTGESPLVCLKPVPLCAGHHLVIGDRLRRTDLGFAFADIRITNTEMKCLSLPTNTVEPAIAGK